MTYGSATVAEHVEAYMRHIYGDKVSRQTITDFERRYRLVGHSPLVEITATQAKALQQDLGEEYIVKSAMRHSEPFIHDVVAECKKLGADHVVGIILSPQFSTYIMEGYKTALFEATRAAGFEDSDVTIAEPWPTEKHFIEFLASRIKAKLQKLRALHGKNIPVIFTTHSLPERVVKSDPSYLDELKATTDAVLKAIERSDRRAVQRLPKRGTHAGGVAETGPDRCPRAAARKSARRTDRAHQFLADHLEILYDLDIAGAEQCAAYGIAYNRIELPNADPLFISSLAATAKATEARLK